MTGPTARDPQPGEPEHRPRWQDAARPDAREVEEALAWFRENPNWVAHMERWRGPMVIKHAATIVRAALAGARPAPAEPAGHDTAPMDYQAMIWAHHFPQIAACNWHRTGKCVCPVQDVVDRLASAGMLAAAHPAAHDTEAWPIAESSDVAPATLCGKHVPLDRRCALPLGDDLVCPAHGQRVLPGPDAEQAGGER